MSNQIVINWPPSSKIVDIADIPQGNILIVPENGIYTPPFGIGVIFPGIQRRLDLTTTVGSNATITVVGKDGYGQDVSENFTFTGGAETFKSQTEFNVVSSISSNISDSLVDLVVSTAWEGDGFSALAGKTQWALVDTLTSPIQWASLSVELTPVQHPAVPNVEYDVYFTIDKVQKMTPTGWAVNTNPLRDIWATAFGGPHTDSKIFPEQQVIAYSGLQLDIKNTVDGTAGLIFTVLVAGIN
jgi:hypothetical protein